MALYSPRGVSGDSAKKAKRKKKDATGEGGGRKRARSPRDPDYAGAGGVRDVGGSTRQTRRGEFPGTGSGGNAPPLQDTPSQRANSAFGQQYASGLFKDDIFANPEALGVDWLSQQGVDPMRGGGLPAVYSDLAAQLPGIFALTQGTPGGTGSAAGLGIESFLDYADQFLNQYSTPGAGSLSANVVSNLFGAQQNSLISNLLNDPNADPQQQAEALLSLLGSGLQASLPGPIAQSYVNQAQGLGDQWVTGAWKGQGKGKTFADYLEEQGLADVFQF